ncbi:lipid-A-disaccharide synthase [Pelagovum pacificum]|uniref:Lipid-A-disaccharide synthase n=1 Tax=Pelagovum pacificum TaxID=2588711 RepID=A0A5C5GE84_9RHOB|nr:lipid-A-disaccharide synthase [Pelagovum pacificum]QQA44548.1 lipid-A-disaccharide synthase [Pelagovum pacificum]TNY32337.1 lipid-A-disaccharide synthase [Pelagovum pacificum]
MRVFLVAGEPSGDRLGGALMEGLRQLVPNVTFDGIGGYRMEQAGLSSRFPMEELSVMGIAEILPKYFDLKRRIAETAQAVIDTTPDVLITIDSPDFSLRVAKLVKAGSDIRTVHYVSPTVWAWRPGRAKKMARMIDQVLALFPFEPPYMEAEGIRCDFVGHPVTTEPVATDAEAEAFRAAHGIGAAPLVLALPGSRKGEIERLADRFGETLSRVVAARPDARIVLPCAAPVAALVREKAASWPGQPILIDPAEDGDGCRKRAAFRAANVALAASGTVSLELAAAATPMVIAYDMSPLSRAIISRMLRVDTVTLVNLVAESRTVPEFIGKDCDPARIAPALLATLDDPGPQQEAMALTMERLGQGGEPPGLRAARAVLDGL